MTMQNPKIERSEIHRSEFKKEQFKEEFKKKIEQFIYSINPNIKNQRSK